VAERGRRVGENEALFREVNERIEELEEEFGSHRTFEIVCECADVSCAEHITVTRDEYTEVRSEPTMFFVIAGHEDLQVEDVVDRRDGFNVVRKREGEPADVARATAPR
jgi:hypothetical protein